ncbi:MAG: oxidoreductase, partial [Bacteroidia bacterium]|nr:oxidoreductase [Bacteroidia bacterium]
RYINCTSKAETGNYRGRVTDYLLAQEVDKNSIYYLCGNSEMVNELTIILEHQGIMPGNIRTEIFF